MIPHEPESKHTYPFDPDLDRPKAQTPCASFAGEAAARPKAQSSDTSFTGGTTGDTTNVDASLHTSQGNTSLPGRVLSQDNTTRENPYIRPADAAFTPDVDSLFAGKPAYAVIKNEKPEHRLMLWLSLQGHSPEQIAKQLGYHVVTVRLIRKQEWFRNAFVRLSAEFGKSAVQTFLEGEVLPALIRTAELALSADSDAVKLSANKELLDRYLGKSVAKTESKISSTIDATVADVTSLLAERARNEEKLRSNGIIAGSN